MSASSHTPRQYKSIDDLFVRMPSGDLTPTWQYRKSLKDKIVIGIAHAFVIGAFISVGAFGMHTYMTSLKSIPFQQEPPDAVCWEILESDLKNKKSGWQRVSEIDRDIFSYRASKGEVEVVEFPSYKCRAYASKESPLVFIAKAPWWRPITKQWRSKNKVKLSKD